ncbi:MAG: sigma 54-interacting transcriptional regulator [Desulfobacterales bacterium]|nr:sigma 54-interacting transcriptional regulator [Desulfobacterales bacterium]
MITGFATLESAVETMKHGAFYYIAKALQARRGTKGRERGRREGRGSRGKRPPERADRDLPGQGQDHYQDRTMQKLLDTAKQVAPVDCNVLITGESGTGKELVARYIHYNSLRSEGPFLAVNCGAFTEELLANELFGHERGAFTGALTMKRGLIETASGGTLFLDEITEMSAHNAGEAPQGDSGKGSSSGSAEHAPLKIDVRFIAATNRNIQDTIREGVLPAGPLLQAERGDAARPRLCRRERMSIPLLSHYFLDKYAVLMKKNVTAIAPDVMALLLSYDFPGNVRELENIIERGVALSHGDIHRNRPPARGPERVDNHDVPEKRRKVSVPGGAGKGLHHVGPEGGGGNKTLAAQVLGIDRCLCGGS